MFSFWVLTKKKKFRWEKSCQAQLQPQVILSTAVMNMRRWPPGRKWQEMIKWLFALRQRVCIQQVRVYVFMTFYHILPLTNALLNPWWRECREHHVRGGKRKTKSKRTERNNQARNTNNTGPYACCKHTHPPRADVYTNTHAHTHTYRNTEKHTGTQGTRASTCFSDEIICVKTQFGSERGIRPFLGGWKEKNVCVCPCVCVYLLGRTERHSEYRWGEEKRKRERNKEDREEGLNPKWCSLPGK